MGTRWSGVPLLSAEPKVHGKTGANGLDGVTEGFRGIARFLCCLVNTNRGTTAANSSYALAA